MLFRSLFDALAGEGVVSTSDTAPVKEVIRHEENGLPAAFRPLGARARALVAEHDDVEKTAPARWRPFGRARE